MIDPASGGALGDMTPAEARNLIEKMASNSQQFSVRNDAIVLDAGKNFSKKTFLERYDLPGHQGTSWWNKEYGTP